MNNRVLRASAYAALLAGMPGLSAYADTLVTDMPTTESAHQGQSRSNAAGAMPTQSSPPRVRLNPDTDEVELAQNAPAPPSTLPNQGSSSGLRTNPSNNTLGNTTLAPTLIPAQPLTGPLSSIGNFLLDHGINLHPALLDHFWANPTSGIIRDQTYNLGFVSINLDVDLQRLVGIPGGNLHFSYDNTYAKSDIPQIVSQAGGTLTGYQTTPALSNTKVAELTYEQRLLNNQLSVEVGRTNIYRYFLLNNSLDPFTSVSTTFSVDADAVPFINPTWGGRVRYNISPAWYVQAGMFEDYWRKSIVRPYNLDTDGAAGYEALAELGYRTDFTSGVAYPGNFEVGFEYDDRSGYTNFKGTARPAQVVVVVKGRTIVDNFTAADYSGGDVFFAQGKQVLWHGASHSGYDPANIAVLGSATFSADKPQPIDFDALAGLQFNGLIPSRPGDSFEFSAHYQRLSQVEANFETAQAIIAQGSGPSQSRNNFAFEAIYNLEVIPAVSFRPYVQYFVNPDAYYDPSEGRAHDGVGVGFFFSASLGRLLGLSPL